MSRYGSGLPFDPGSSLSATALDYPGVLIDNIFRGRLLEAGLRPSQMGPEDRATLADRLKKDLGDFPLTNAIIEIGLNPWVWLGVATSAVLPAAPAVTRTFDDIAPRYVATVRKDASLLSMVGATTAQQDFAGTDIIDILDKVGLDMGAFMRISERANRGSFRSHQEAQQAGSISADARRRPATECSHSGQTPRS
jgi:hypothetical protein